MAALAQDILGAASALLILFGALAFWPLVRFGGGFAGGAAELLKWQFYGHVLLLAGSFVLVQYYYASGHPGRLHLQFLPYAVGGLSWISALVILFGTGLWRSLGTHDEERD